MKCIHKECICRKCERYRRKICWRRKTCEEKQKEGYCKSYVADCARFLPFAGVKEVNNNG